MRPRRGARSTPARPRWSSNQVRLRVALIWYLQAFLVFTSLLFVLCSRYYPSSSKPRIQRTKQMIIEEITVTAFQQHTRIIGCESTKHAICIDPGDESERIVEILERLGLQLKAIALTHAHLDHVGAVASLKKLVPTAKINLHQGDEFLYQALPEQPAWIGIPRAQWAAL